MLEILYRYIMFAFLILSAVDADDAYLLVVGVAAKLAVVFIFVAGCVLTVDSIPFLTFSHVRWQFEKKITSFGRLRWIINR